MKMMKKNVTYTNDEKECDLIIRGQWNLEFMVNRHVVVNRYILIILVFLQHSCLFLCLSPLRDLMLINLTYILTESCFSILYAF